MATIPYEGEVEVYVSCSACNTELKATVSKMNWGIEIEVEPCPGCMDDAAKNALEEA